MDMFLSYSRKNEAVVDELKAALEKAGHMVWKDKEQLVTGTQWRVELENAIKANDAILLAITPDWLESPYCQWEFITAVENGKKVIPVLLAKSELPDRLRSYQYADLRDGVGGDKLEKLLNDLVKLMQIVQQKEIADMDKDKNAQQIDDQINGDNNVQGNNSGNITYGDNNSGVQGNNSGNTTYGNNTTINQGNTYTHTGSKISIGGGVYGKNINMGDGEMTVYEGGNPAGDEVWKLILELQKALDNVSPEQAEDADFAKEDLDSLKEEVNGKNPSLKKLQRYAERLQKSLEPFAPLLPVVAQIIKKLPQIGG